MPVTIEKRVLAKRISDKFGFRGTVVKAVIQAFMDEVIDELSQGHRLELRDFGIFHPVIRKGHRGRNPRTGASVDVPSKMAVHFKAGKVLKEVVKNNHRNTRT